MDDSYSDLLSRQRPVHTDDAFSRRHPKMARLNRAKLFAPFAALSGFEQAVRSKEVPYVPRHILDADECRALNQTLNRLHQATRTGTLARRNRVEARVVFFEICTDVNNEAFERDGLYHAVTGIVQKVDPISQTLMIDSRVIPFRDICSISICNLANFYSNHKK